MTGVHVGKLEGDGVKQGEIAASPQRSGRAILPLVILATIVLGSLYAANVPQGLPYDEPSHWQTARYYGVHRSLPELGDRGVTYQAEQPPLAYVVMGATQQTASAVGLNDVDQLLVTRLVSGLELVVLT